MFRFIFLILAVLTLSAWSGCDQSPKDPDNQIVVIGNGMNWKHSVVADVATKDGVGSMLLNQDKLVPLQSQLQADSSTSTVSPANTGLVQLDWIIPNASDQLLLKLRDPSSAVKSDDSTVAADLKPVTSPECLFYAGAVDGKPHCKRD